MEKLSSSSVGDIRLLDEESPLIPRDVVRSLLPFNILPLVHLLLTLVTPLLLAAGTIQRICLGLLILYALPPLAARFVLRKWRLEEGNISISSSSFRTWWILFQLQMLFSRVPLLEECLRIVPGLYSAWLRAWGSSVGSFVFWGAGTQVFDRTHLTIGDRAATGAGARITAHLFQTGESGNFELAFGRVEVGSDVLIGAYSLVGPGVVIPKFSVTHAYTLLPPFSTWRQDSRKRAGRTPHWQPPISKAEKVITRDGPTGDGNG